MILSYVELCYAQLYLLACYKDTYVTVGYAAP